MATTARTIQRRGREMTIQEAINHANEVAKINRTRTKHKALHNNDKDEINACLQCAEEHEQLAEWLEEIQQYRAIGTVEECREAMEKQKAKKPSEFKYNDNLINYGCPVCKRKFISKINGEWSVGNFNKYCERCGQAIDWSEVN